MRKSKLTFGSDLLKTKLNLNEYNRCALLCNHSSFNLENESSVSICQKILGDKLRVILAPQHGFWGTEQDNMIETNHTFDSHLNLKIFSLYHHKREPTQEMLELFDTLFIDLQIVGCRVYTYKWTMLNCLKSAKKNNKKIVILDRPNPLGGKHCFGKLLDLEASSFVGLASIPMQHGLTIGELSLFLNQDIHADLEVIKMHDYDCSKVWHEYSHKWFFTSPNLPSFESVFLYPGMVLFEGTNISEGRGTTLPFQLIGAPYIKDGNKLIAQFNEYNIDTKGIHLRATRFKPTFGKWSQKVCNGIHITVDDFNTESSSFIIGLGILKAILTHYREFQWKKPPYEYEFEKKPIDLILGTINSDKQIYQLTPKDPFWQKGVNDFKEIRKQFFLYKRTGMKSDQQ